jgi:hypothetical protein
VSPVRVLPDTEAVAVAYLRTVVEVSAIVGDRIGTTLDLTEDTDLPALRLTRVSARTIARRHLRGSNVQLEAFAVDELAAQDLCELAWAALFEPELVGTWAGLGVVTGVDPALDPRSFQDPDTETPRWLASVVIYAHPVPE